MIYVTGDIHGDPSRFSKEIFPEQKEMGINDCVIICGDFGLVWWKEENKTEKYWLDWLEQKPYVTAFCDGNHENFDRLNAFPVTEWNGGKVHKIRDNVIHLMRGEMYQIDGQSVFVFGGARSHDIRGLASSEELKRDYAAGILDRNDPEFRRKKLQIKRYGSFTRIVGESWWKEEMPTEEEMRHGMETLKAHGMKAVFIISHDGPASDLVLLNGGGISVDPLNLYLEDVRQQVDFRKWFFGHHHMDRQITDREAVLYEQIVRIS